jgi:hypothetical protein
MKKGPLSNKEKDHIRSNLEMDVTELAKSMDRSAKIVSNYVEKALSEKHASQPKKASAASNLLARNKDRGIVVMTEASSMESDKTRKRPEPPSRYHGMIHQIKGD